MPRNGVKRKLGRQRTLGFVTLALFVTASAFGATMAVTQPPSSARTSSEIQLTSAAGSHLEPRFSPDGKYIAYASNQSGSYGIWTMTLDGRKQSEVASMTGAQVMPEWSPNGSRIAFIWRHSSFSDLCFVSIYVDDQGCITEGASVQNFAWSPDGSVIAYDAGNGTIRIHSFVDGSDAAFPFGAKVRDPSFGPSPDRLYFSARTGQGDYIWSANIDGSDPAQLSHTGSDYEPQVSPSGDRVMYLTNMSGRCEPWLIDLKTGANLYLFSTPDLPWYTFPEGPLLAIGTVPSWGPNGTSILLISNDNASQGNLYLVTLDFSVEVDQPPLPRGTTFTLSVFNRVPFGGSVRDAEWSPSGNVVVETTVSGCAQLFLLQNGLPVKVGYGG